MKTLTTLVTLSFLGWASMAYSQTPPAPETPPAATTSPATTSAPALPPKVTELLDRLEKVGKKYPTLQASIEYVIENPVLATTETRTGTVYIQQQTDSTQAKSRLVFETAKYDNGPVQAEKLEYAFDGQWLSILKFKIKNMTRKQIAAPGEKVEPFKLGKGPFPLPFGQKAADVARMFNLKTRDARPTDPKNTDYLDMTPKPGNEKEFDFTRLQIWIDKETGLPVKVLSNERNKDLKTGNFRDVKAGVTFDQKMFKPEKPAGWEMVIEP